jgi:hypothetical protein
LTKQKTCINIDMDDYIRDRYGKIIGRYDGDWLRDSHGTLVAQYNVRENVTRDRNGKIVGTGDIRMMLLDD